MKDSTHILFALGSMNLFVLLFVPSVSQAWLLTLLSPILGIISVLPNKLDQMLGFGDCNFITDRSITKFRHPLSHSPYTIGYFFPLVYLVQSLDIAVLESLVMLMVICWMSHLLLDALTENGIPLGKRPVIQNHPTKHYHWIQTSKTHVLRLGRFKVSCIEKGNRRFTNIGLFLILMNIFDLLLNKRLNLLGLI